MNFRYLSPAHITLSEETEDYSNDTGNVTVETKYWVAKYSGKSFNLAYGLVEAVGPEVEVTRTGATAHEAEDNLLQALIEQGWEMR